jgi:DNA-binding MarR family transcriptional regulator
MVQLSPKGEELYDDASKGHGAYLSNLAEVLTPEEQKEFSRLAKKLGLALLDLS